MRRLAFVAPLILAGCALGVRAGQSRRMRPRGGALFGPSVDMALHGHVHLFEALGFTPGGVPTFVLGNSGSMGEGGLPAALPQPARAIGGVRIAAFHTRAGFGFALLERRDALWRLTEYAEDGRPLLACEVAAPTLHCAPAAGH